MKVIYKNNNPVHLGFISYVKNHLDLNKENNLNYDTYISTKKQQEINLEELLRLEKDIISYFPKDWSNWTSAIQYIRIFLYGNEFYGESFYNTYNEAKLGKPKFSDKCLYEIINKYENYKNKNSELCRINKCIWETEKEIKLNCIYFFDYLDTNKVVAKWHFDNEEETLKVYEEINKKLKVITEEIIIE